MTRDEHIRAAFKDLTDLVNQLTPEDDATIAGLARCAWTHLRASCEPQPVVEILDRAEDVYTEYGITCEDYEPEDTLA